MVIARNTDTNDDQFKRASRLTSGDNSFESKSILRNADDDVSGLSLEVATPKDNVNVTLCKENQPWTVTFNIMCDATQTKALQYNKLSYLKNADKCTITFNAVHKAGCGAIKASGFVQYLNANPWIIALAMIAGGIVVCFMGGHLYEHFVVGITGLFVFLFVSVMLSSLGLFDVMAEDEETTGKGVIMAIIGVVLASALGVGAGYFIEKTQDIAKGVVGGIAGFFAGFTLYTLVFAQFITSSTILLWITLIITTAAGGFLMFTKGDEAEVHVTAFVGAYLIVRGASLVLGGFPNEAETFYKLSAGNFHLPGTFYIYLVVFAALYYAGNKYQHFKEYHIEG